MSFHPKTILGSSYHTCSKFSTIPLNVLLSLTFDLISIIIIYMLNLLVCCRIASAFSGLSHEIDSGGGWSSNSTMLPSVSQSCNVTFNSAT